MAKGQASFVQNIQALFDAGSIGELTDRQLLELLATGDRDAAELAFAVLVRRHGPMVFHACCSILRDRHEAEDAFQATFLVLSRKAASLWLRDSIGPWLFGVACRVASSARSATIRRKSVERKAAESATTTAHDPAWDDCDIILHEELGRLPNGYRMAVALCDLEGLTHEQAARQLGWPAGTVRSRLARGRERLRYCLVRRGLAPAVVAMGAPLARDSVPASLIAMTVENALGLGAGQGATGPMASSIALMEGTLRVMFVSKLKLVAAVGLAGGVLIFGSVLIGHGAMGRAQLATAAVKTEPLNQAGVQVQPAGAIPPDAEPLSPSAQARLWAAKMLRDSMMRRFTDGEIDAIAYLQAQRRYNDVVIDVGVKTVADQVRVQEVLVRGLKSIENVAGAMRAAGRGHDIDRLVIESERLEAEEALARARAKLAAGADAAEARLKVAEKLTDQMHRLYAGGEILLDEYLLWQKRCNDLAREVMLLKGGNIKQLLENQLAAMNELKRQVEGLAERGQTPPRDALKVDYYRLEIVEALASEQDGSDIPAGKD
jgi:RNA polymerase sigma factor (sigma-70 family)